CSRGATATNSEPCRTWHDLLQVVPQAAPSSQGMESKWMETFLHGVPTQEIKQAVADLCHRHPRFPATSGGVMDILRRMFNNIALSPWTDLTEKTLQFVREWHDANLVSDESVIAIFGYLLRQLSRHLIAYDLVTFHHRGANYPDALLLDLVLK